MEDRGLAAVKDSWAAGAGAGVAGVVAASTMVMGVVAASTMVTRTMTRAIADADPLVPIGLSILSSISKFEGRIEPLQFLTGKRRSKWLCPCPSE